MNASATSTRDWSPAQTAVFAWVEAPTAPHLVVEALAGSGKTTTLVEAVCRTPESQRVLVCAFNAAIAKELASRLPADVDCRTLHSLGLRALTAAQGRREVDGDATMARAKRLLGNRWDSSDARRALCKLVSLAKATLTLAADELDALADRYGLEFPEKCDRARMCRQAEAILRETLASTGGPIDFDDMIWLPIVLDLPIPTYDWVFVDETQDLNPTQLELCVRAAGARGRIVAIGDRHQAIYGFRGADRAAIPRMITRLSAATLPLNVTYRCPLAVVREAQRYVPALCAAPGAAPGVVRECEAPELTAHAAPGDAVISRTNAPLIVLCLRWLAEGRRASIRGRDIGAGLIAWVRGQRARTVPELVGAIRTWSERETARLIAAERPCDHVAERAACLEALTIGAASPAEVLERCERLFSDADGAGSIVCSSTHRAKGLEFPRVWMLRDTFGQWPGQEEKNLTYVAITRAQRELVFVRGVGGTRRRQEFKRVGEGAMPVPRHAATLGSRPSWLPDDEDDEDGEDDEQITREDPQP